MKTTRHLVIAMAAVALLALAGCKKAVLDGTSDATLDASYGPVQDAMPEERRSEFAEAYAGLVTSRALVEADTGKSFNEALNGRTGVEVIDLYKRIQIRQEKQERRRLALEKGMALRISGEYAESLTQYKAAQDAGADDADTQTIVDELESLVGGMAHVKSLDTKVQALQAMSNGKLGLRFSITNGSDVDFSLVRVRVIFRDENGKELAEEIYDPIGGAEGGSLPAGGTWEMPPNQHWSPSVRIPSGWNQEKTRVRIIGLVMAKANPAE